MRFEKWQALGNDYLILEREELPFALTPARVRLLCAGHFGVHADGVLLLSPPADPNRVADLRIFNPDGSEAELSGNGAREAILYLRRRGWTDREQFVIGTAAGEIRPRITGPDTCTVDMGRASLSSADFPGGPADGRGAIQAAGHTWAFRHVSIGNPQCAIHLDTLEQLEGLDLALAGPPIEADPQLPEPHERLLVHGARCRRSPRAHPGAHLRARGGGDAVIGHRRHRRGGRPRPRRRHGRRRRARRFLAGDGRARRRRARGRGRAGLEINLTGWARPVFDGRLSEEFEKELHETE